MRERVRACVRENAWGEGPLNARFASADVALQSLTRKQKKIKKELILLGPGYYNKLYQTTAQRRMERGDDETKIRKEGQQTRGWDGRRQGRALEFWDLGVAFKLLVHGHELYDYHTVTMHM